MKSNSAKIETVRVANRVYDTIAISTINLKLKGNDTRFAVQPDGDVKTVEGTESLTFAYSIGKVQAGQGGQLIMNQNDTLRGQVSLSGDQLPTSFSYDSLIKLALQDANKESDVSFKLA